MRLIIIFSFFITTLFFSCNPAREVGSYGDKKNDDVVLVQFPEVYELANIVIALTEDGIRDEWKVQKNFPYYREMRQYFEPMKDHPLLDSVNFERKRWKEFLSFRTDSYAFQFDAKSKLKRTSDFRSFEISEFDDHLDLIQDFVEQSNFRDFYSKNGAFWNRLDSAYKKNYMINEMRAFLSDHFDEELNDQKFIVVLSPLVGGQHLQRSVDTNSTASFVNISTQLINGVNMNDEDKSSIVHTLFTEMDHAYVNPVTDKYDLKNKFVEKLWENESGYTGSGKGVFNEYMTWAVFDIFNAFHFPELADKINLNWHFQNETRGFVYSNLFSTKLKELYNKYDDEKKIKDLYPELLEWTQEIQTKLSKPQIVNSGDTLNVSSPSNLIELQFSEPMKKLKEFDIVLQYGQWNRETIKIGKKNTLKWNEDGDSLSFEVELPNSEEYYLFFNWWGVDVPLISKNGILLQALNGFRVKGNSAFDSE